MRGFGWATLIHGGYVTQGSGEEKRLLLDENQAAEELFRRGLADQSTDEAQIDIASLDGDKGVVLADSRLEVLAADDPTQVLGGVDFRTAGDLVDVERGRGGLVDESHADGCAFTESGEFLVLTDLGGFDIAEAEAARRVIGSVEISTEGTSDIADSVEMPTRAIRVDVGDAFAGRCRHSQDSNEGYHKRFT